MVALTLSVAIQGAALSAPLVHAHPGAEATEHHSGRAVHTHWGGHAHEHSRSDDPAFRTADQDRAVFLNAFVAAAASVSSAIAVAPDLVEVPVPAERAAHRTVEITHGHDPPASRSLPSRAPPAFLS